MTLCRHRLFRVLIAAFFLVGVLGFVDGAPATWGVLPLSALLSALLLPALLTQRALVPAKVQRDIEVIR
jgi:hypothetical protein